MLIKNQEPFHVESATVRKAGLASRPWQHLDSTGTTVHGHQQQCHILCNPVYTAYSTLPTKDRMTLLRVLQGGADPLFQVNELALELLTQLGVSAKWRGLLPVLLPPDQIFTENQFDTVLTIPVPIRSHTTPALEGSLRHCGPPNTDGVPGGWLLLCDDAPQFNCLAAQLALCSIHEYRHYKRLIPRFLAHCKILEAFAKDFWDFYQDLLAYRDYPSVEEANALRAAFDHLFGQTSGYQQLDERLAKTLANKESLLMVLSHPENSLAQQSS